MSSTIEVRGTGLLTLVFLISLHVIPAPQFFRVAMCSAKSPCQGRSQRVRAKTDKGPGSSTRNPSAARAAASCCASKGFAFSSPRSANHLPCSSHAGGLDIFHLQGKNSDGHLHPFAPFFHSPCLDPLDPHQRQVGPASRPAVTCSLSGPIVQNSKNAVMKTPLGKFEPIFEPQQARKSDKGSYRGSRTERWAPGSTGVSLTHPGALGGRSMLLAHTKPLGFWGTLWKGKIVKGHEFAWERGKTLHATRFKYPRPAPRRAAFLWLEVSNTPLCETVARCAAREGKLAGKTLGRGPNKFDIPLSLLCSFGRVSIQDLEFRATGAHRRATIAPLEYPSRAGGVCLAFWGIATQKNF